jgi:hypothetical protein
LLEDIGSALLEDIGTAGMEDDAALLEAATPTLEGGTATLELTMLKPDVPVTGHTVVEIADVTVMTVVVGIGQLTASPQ